MIRFHTSDEFRSMYLQNPFLLNGGRFIENNIVVGQKVIDGIWKVFKPGEVVPGIDFK